MIKPKLIKIADNRWIDPSIVQEILAIDRDPKKGFGPRVLIEIESDAICIHCDDFEVATIMCDNIAAMVNLSRI